MLDKAWPLLVKRGQISFVHLTVPLASPLLPLQTKYRIYWTQQRTVKAVRGHIEDDVIEVVECVSLYRIHTVPPGILTSPMTPHRQSRTLSLPKRANQSTQRSFNF